MITQGGWLERNFYEVEGRFGVDLGKCYYLWSAELPLWRKCEFQGEDQYYHRHDIYKMYWIRCKRGKKRKIPNLFEELSFPKDKSITYSTKENIEN